MAMLPPIPKRLEDVLPWAKSMADYAQQITPRSGGGIKVKQTPGGTTFSKAGGFFAILDSEGLGLGEQETNTLAIRADGVHAGEYALAGVEGMTEVPDDYKGLRLRVTGVNDDVDILWGFQHLFDSVNQDGSNFSLSSLAGIDYENKLESYAYEIAIGADNTTDVSSISGPDEIQYWLNFDDITHMTGHISPDFIDMSALYAFFSDSGTGFNHDSLADVFYRTNEVRGHDEVYWRAFDTTPGGPGTYISAEDYVTTGDCGAQTFRIQALINEWSGNGFYVDTTVGAGPVDIISGDTWDASSIAAMTLAPNGLFTLDAALSADINVTGDWDLDATGDYNVAADNVSLIAVTDGQLSAPSGAMIVDGSTLSLSGTLGVSMSTGIGADVSVDFNDAGDMFDVKVGGYAIDSVDGATLSGGAGDWVDRGLVVDNGGASMLVLTGVRVQGVVGVQNVEIWGRVT